MYPREFVREGDQPLQPKQSLVGCLKMRARPISCPDQGQGKAHIPEGAGPSDQIAVRRVYLELFIPLHSLSVVAGVRIR